LYKEEKMLKTEHTVVRADKVDNEFVKRIEEFGDPLACFQCGTCYASCPSGRRTAMNVRRLVRLAGMGLKEQVINDESLWACTTCYTCYERCPRDVKPIDVLIGIRNVAVEQGFMLEGHVKTCNALMKYGHAVSINEDVMKMRESLGLSPVPPTIYAHPDQLERARDVLFSKFMPEEVKD